MCVSKCAILFLLNMPGHRKFLWKVDLNKFISFYVVYLDPLAIAHTQGRNIIRNLHAQNS